MFQESVIEEYTEHVERADRGRYKPLDFEYWFDLTRELRYEEEKRARQALKDREELKRILSRHIPS